ncbi:oligosaccharide flippase family protein [Dactylosporangium sp. NPDC000555]|uniref:oligosaccharide flippase family protein n=1 Tax=Dactylosporangium sp. NPDC000555 TaxID=3154260 RepID=UPI0033173FFF
MTALVTPAPRRVRARRLVAGNLVARLGALISLAAATVLVARTGGPDQVGAFTLLRVLPGLAGVVAAAGLPGAAPFFLGSRSADPRLRPTLVALTWLGATAAAAGWLALTPALRLVFFQSWGAPMVAAAAVAVFTQLFVAVGKALLQGSGDLPGANAAIVGEEAVFLPLYLALLPFGAGVWTLLWALAAADAAVAVVIAVRLRRLGFFAGWGRPSHRLGRQICGYGWRGQLGGILALVNLRLDVAVLGALAGPATLGVYAVASKYAELLRLPGQAVNYVLYPAFAARDGRDARARTRALLAPAAGLTALAAIPLALAAGTLLPLLYGPGFGGAVVPVWILLGGLIGEGVAGVVTAYLYGVGRPGLTSLAVGIGVAVTVAGDLLLIPRHGVVGAAVASSVAYLLTVATLLACFALTRRSGP